jgi:hypothetical protein
VGSCLIAASVQCAGVAIANQTVANNTPIVGLKVRCDIDKILVVASGLPMSFVSCVLLAAPAFIRDVAAISRVSLGFYLFNRILCGIWSISNCYYFRDLVETECLFCTCAGI